MKAIVSRLTNNVAALINAAEPFLPILIGVFYFLCNKDFAGLQYNTDEFGYLSKFIFLSGHDIIYPSQWRFGYAMLLLPVAWMTKDPCQMWFNFVIYQSFIWCLVFYMLRRFITFIRPDITPAKRFFIVLICSLYPSWCIMTGYAFTSTMTVFLYMVMITLISRWDGKSFFEPLAAAAVAGIFYWMHPLALSVFIPLLFAVLVGTRESYKKCFIKIFAVVFVLILFCILYKVISSVIDKQISDDISRPVHYTIGGGAGLRNTDLILIIAMWFSHISTLGLTTLGAGFCGLSALCHQILSRFFKKFEAPLPEHATTIAFFCAFSSFAVAGIVAIFFPQQACDRSYYHWIYCRYFELFTLPLLAMCFLVKWRVFYFLLPCFSLYAGYFGLQNYVKEIRDNPINTYSLAVKNVCEYFNLLQGKTDYLVTQHLIYSAAVIVLIGLFAWIRKMKVVLYILFLFVCIIGIDYGLARHEKYTLRARTYRDIAKAVEKSGLENEVAWDSIFHRNRKHLTYFEYTHYSYPRVAFWTSAWSFETTESWLKHKRGILFTDFVKPLLDHDDLFIYRIPFPPYKFIASKKALPECQDLEVTGMWENGRQVPAAEFLRRYSYPKNEFLSGPKYSDIYFRAPPGVKYLHLRLTDTAQTPFYLNGKEIVPLFGNKSLWVCFDVSDVIQPCNELVFAPAGKKLNYGFRILSAVLGDRIFAEKEFFTRTQLPPGRIYATGKNDGPQPHSLVVPRGQLQYGPYVLLPPGVWQVLIQGTNLEQGAFDVHYSCGTIRHIQKIKSIRHTQNGSIYIFSHEQTNGQFEFRCQNRGKKDLTIANISLKACPGSMKDDPSVNVIPKLESQGIPLNYKIYFNRSLDELNLTGFYSTEAAGKWASAKAQIEFKLKQMPENGIVLKFSLGPYKNEQIMQIKDPDGNLIRTLQISRASDYFVTLDQDYFNKYGSKVMLQMEFPMAKQPESDARTLSCFFHCLELIPGQLVRLPSGGTINFSELKLSEHHGFSYPEKWGTWSTAKNCFMRFALPENRKSQSVHLQFNCQAFSKLKSVKVYCNGKYVATWNIPNTLAAVYDLKLNVPLTEQSIELRFEQFDIASPFEVDKTDDHRKLGLGFISVKYLPENS